MPPPSQMAGKKKSHSAGQSERLKRTPSDRASSPAAAQKEGTTGTISAS